MSTLPFVIPEYFHLHIVIIFAELSFQSDFNVSYGVTLQNAFVNSQK